jgi:phage shock protein E
MVELKVVGFLALFFGALLLVSCQRRSDIVPPEQVHQMVARGALLVDVRTEAEHRLAHLPNSKLIPIAQLEARMAEFGEDKDREIVLYCRTGNRSGKAADLLRSHGFTNLHNCGEPIPLQL